MARTDRTEANDAPVTRSATGAVVGRHALFERLAGAGRVTLVSAPAGSGKTLLLRSWNAETGLAGQVGWVPVPRRECDPERFWISVLDALRATEAGAALVRPLTAAPELDGWLIVEWLLEDLSNLEGPLWLVLDDVHELRSEEALAQLQLLVLRAPARLRLVLVTRQDLRLGLHRLRLEGELTELRAADLRFTIEEARSLFRSVGLDLSVSALALLYERTEGWAAGLRLAALGLAGHPDPERFAAEFSGSERTVAEYLFAEVLDGQPERVRRLLLRTSILERVSGPLADLLTGDAGGQRVLLELQKANAFVVALDVRQTWFRYHPLFADLLELELRSTAPGEVAALHAAAAGWFVEHGSPVEAVRHAQAAEDWPLAARLLGDYTLSLQLDGQFATAHELLAGFPVGVLESDAEFTVLRALDQVVQGSVEEARGCLVRATEAAGRVPADRRRRFEVRLTLLRLALARHRSDLPAVVEEAQRLLAPTEDPGAAPLGPDAELRALALVSLGITELWSAHVADAERHLQQGIAVAHRINRPYLEVKGLAHLALAAGRSYRSSIRHSRQAIEVALRHGWSNHPNTGVAYAVLGGTLATQGQFEEAKRWLERAGRTLHPEVEPAAGMMLFQARGMLELARGRNRQALEAFAAADRLGGLLVSPHIFAGLARAYQLHTLLRMGETKQIEQILAAMQPQERNTAEMRTVLAGLHLVQGDPSAAVAALAPVLDGARLVHLQPWTTHAIVQLLLEAIAREALGDPGAAEQALEQALDLAEPDGVLSPFLLVPAKALLERHRQRSGHAALINDIIDLLAGHRLPPSRGELEPLREPLTASETRVLRYLPTNLSAPEIAGELYVSVHTVKTHLRHLYAKLGAHRRAEAVERARALSLLAPMARGH